MHFLLLNVFFFQNASWQAKIQDRQYLSAARSLQHDIAENPSPNDLLQYTFLTVDQYVQEVGFRVFYLRDMDSQEKVDFFRSDPKAGGHVETQASELNLEALLMNFREGFPDSFEVQLAIAYYLYHGQGKMLQPRLKMDADRIHELFVRAEERNITTPFLRVALAKWDRQQNGTWSATDLDRCQKAYAAEPHRRDIATTLIECLLDLGKNEDVLSVAKNFFNDSYALADRLFMLHATTIAHVRLGHNEAACKTVAVGLRLAPEHFAMWRDGLPAALAPKDPDFLRRYIALWLRDRELDPAAFQAFLSCFSASRDRISDIIGQRSSDHLSSDFEKMLFHFNQASFWVFIGQTGKANAELGQARQLAKLLNDQAFLALIDEVQQKMAQPPKQ
ncbi:MAG: hypothetical protein H6510_12750 [Acidobacteria bacterium]|nr:hypothetical protein [Acidobacteriota bacterium]MCB9398676.1 hypothetical protein [Acidobacteriota bacterium]